MKPFCCPNLTEIVQWGTKHGFVVRDVGALHGALTRALTSVGGQDVYPTALSKTAALVDSVVNARPFVDGNKRMGFLVAAVTLRMNGYDDTYASDTQWYELLINISTAQLKIDQIAACLEDMAPPLTD